MKGRKPERKEETKKIRKTEEKKTAKMSCFKGETTLFVVFLANKINKQRKKQQQIRSV